MEVKDIVVGSIWKGNLNKDFIAIVDEIIFGNYQIDVELTIFNTKTSETSTHSFNTTYFIKAYTPLLTIEDLNLEYVKGKMDGYNEGYQNGFTLAKEKITKLNEQERQQIYYDGYDSGHNQWQNDYGFTIPNNTIKNLEATNYKKGLKDKAKINAAERQHHYDMGYNDALAHMASEEAENALKLKKQGYEEGYDGGFEDGYNTAIKEVFNNQALGETTEYEFGTEDCCGVSEDENHNPNKETQEAMQEVLDNRTNEFEGIWVAKDGSGKLKVLNIDKGICDVELVEYVGDSYLCMGDTTTISVDYLKEHWTKERAECNYITTEDDQLEKELKLVEKYPHYYKDIRHLNIIDIYRFFDLFEVTDPCIQHSTKKLAVGGKRGAKDYEKDIKEAMDTLKRWEYMQEENKRGLDD